MDFIPLSLGLDSMPFGTSGAGASAVIQFFDLGESVFTIQFFDSTGNNVIWTAEFGSGKTADAAAFYFDSLVSSDSGDLFFSSLNFDTVTVTYKELKYNPFPPTVVNATLLSSSPGADAA